VLGVESSVGFVVGMDIVINPDTPVMEFNTISAIRAFGTIELAKPLLYSHETGAKVVQSARNTPPQSKAETDEIGNGNEASAMIAVASGAATLAVLSLSMFVISWYRGHRKQEAKPEANIDEFVSRLEELEHQSKPQDVDDSRQVDDIIIKFEL